MNSKSAASDTVHEARSTAQIAQCFAVMQQLRPALKNDEFIARVNAQRAGGYRLVYLEAGGEVVCVAGFRIAHCLAWGQFLYVDDLVTDAAQRSHGYGKTMLRWLRDEALRTQCEQFHLDSGVQRKEAHRFYLREGMQLSSYHFAEVLAAPQPGIK